MDQVYTYTKEKSITNLLNILYMILNNIIQEYIKISTTIITHHPNTHNQTLIDITNNISLYYKLLIVHNFIIRYLLAILGNQN